MNPTVRFVYNLCPTVRFGAVFQYRKTCGAVRCGFKEGKDPTVRFDAVNHTEPHRTDRKNRTVKNPPYFIVTLSPFTMQSKRVNLKILRTTNQNLCNCDHSSTCANMTTACYYNTCAACANISRPLPLPEPRHLRLHN